MTYPVLIENEKQLDALYLSLDKKQIKRTRNLQLIPEAGNRRGGKSSFAEWAHVIGLFQSILFMNLEAKSNNTILDVGCGTGLMGIASYPYVLDKGKYIGIDVSREDIGFCRSHYPPEHFSFIHFDVHNAVYAPDQPPQLARWPIEAGSVTAVTALSVWTHLNEDEALFYLAEVKRVLKDGGTAVITFFKLDSTYYEHLETRADNESAFYPSKKAKWVFDQKVSASGEWFCPKWVNVPEQAIGVTDAGIERLCAHSGLRLRSHYTGSFKEVPGLFFQDVLILCK